MNGASARARSTRPKPGSSFIAFPRPFWVFWLAKVQWWSIRPDRSRWGKGIGEAQAHAAASSLREPEHHKQRAIEVLGCFPANMADDASNPVVAERDHLVRHDLRAK